MRLNQQDRRCRRSCHERRSRATPPRAQISQRRPASRTRPELLSASRTSRTRTPRLLARAFTAGPTGYRARSRSPGTDSAPGPATASLQPPPIARSAPGSPSTHTSRGVELRCRPRQPGGLGGRVPRQIPGFASPSLDGFALDGTDLEQRTPLLPMNVSPGPGRDNGPLVLKGYWSCRRSTERPAKEARKSSKTAVAGGLAVAQGRYAPEARTASGDPPLGRGSSLRRPAGRPGHAWPEPKHGGSQDVPPDPSAQRQCRRGQGRDDKREARQVRLQRTPPSDGVLDVSPAAGRSCIGRKPRKIPGFASPSLDGFALDGSDEGSVHRCTSRT